MSEYVEFIGKYPNICFSDDPSKRNKDHSLFQLECANVIPDNYLTENVKKYKKVYTWNGKLFEEYKKLGLNVVKIPNFPLFDNYYTLERFIPYEERVSGITLICRYRVEQIRDFDISIKRVEVFNKLDGITKHTYGKMPYCGEHYKGVIGDSSKETYPSSLSKLKKMNEYKFNLCFENAYHEFWSFDYITEKITDCFKAKVIPIYWGCYNIEDRIPPGLYIDYREFSNEFELVSRINSISKGEFEDMTEKAYIWEKKTQLGNIEELKGILDND